MTEGDTDREERSAIDPRSLAPVPGLTTHWDDGVLTVRLDRPEARNALSIALRRGLIDAVRAADSHDATHVVVLTGTDPAFSAGIDLAEAMPADGPSPAGSRIDPARTLRAAAVPVIAAVNGPCYTGALELVLSCSFAVASERAEFADTHAQLGLVSGWGMSAMLPAAVGTRFARRMMLTGEVVDADTALRVGLVSEVTPHAELGARARALARSVAAAHPGAVSATQEVLAAGDGAGLPEALELERSLRKRWRVDPDDVVRRFRDRRR
jgi:enoyl-CoA hydratase